MKENDYSKNWKPIIRWRHRLAAWGFTRLKPTEPYESYYVYGKYIIPPEKIPSEWIGKMDESKERELRFKAYQEACDQYAKTGIGKRKREFPFLTKSKFIKIYANMLQRIRLM